MARTPNSRKEETHDRILHVAARALRRHGYTGTGVAGVMKEAGLTHGGFYAHFGSRDAMLVEALQQAGRESRDVVLRAIQAARPGITPFRALVETYLADDHLGQLEIGCPVAALGCDMPRQTRSVRAASAKAVRQLITAVQSTLSPASAPTAAMIAATMVGTLQLGRTLGNNAEGRGLLSSVRGSLLQAHDRSLD